MFGETRVPRGVSEGTVGQGRAGYGVGVWDTKSVTCYGTPRGSEILDQRVDSVRPNSHLES